MRAKERLPRKRYSPEFKMELVRLALEQEGSIAALARQHDVNDNLLFKWIRLWQREGRVCRPRKKSSSLPALIPVQLQVEPSSPTFELPSCPPPSACHIKCRGGEITLTHPSAELMSTVLRELMRGAV
ncbi:TPA: transposase [Klebsiella variicola]|uniref:IS66-like element accessory protein TnpA n=2 Tax=Klebsiella pneumoniae complex TaxID=3390273 RepID=UPI000E3E79BF|nr:transposase [Klebsiella variicola]HBR1875162.1 transposase [Klebsiella variicola]